MGWLLGIGAVAAVIGGVWYWRNLPDNRLRRQLACGISNAKKRRDEVQALPSPPPDLVPGQIDGDIEVMRVGLDLLERGIHDARVDAAKAVVMNYCG